MLAPHLLLLNLSQPLFYLIQAEWHIYISKLTNTGTDNGLSPGRRQAIIWTNAGILSIEPLGLISVKS